MNTEVAPENKRELLAPFPQESNVDPLQKTALPQQKDIATAKPFDIANINEEVTRSLKIPPSETTDVDTAKYLMTQINYLNDLVNEAEIAEEQGLTTNINKRKALQQMKYLKTQYQSLYPKKQEDIQYEEMLKNAGEAPILQNPEKEVQSQEDYAKMMATEKENLQTQNQQQQDYQKMMEEARKKENTFLNPNDTALPVIPSALGITEEQRLENERNRLQDVRNQRRYSLISKAGYDTHYNDIDTAEKNLKVYLPAHDIIREFTDEESTTVIKRHPDGQDEIIFTIRGTDPSSLKDLQADAFILAGLPVNTTDRYINAENKYIKLREAYPDAKIIITAHSLGSTIGLDLAKKYDLEAHLFNIGSSPMEYLTGFPQGGNKVTIYHIKGDPISVANSLGSKDRIVLTETNSYAQYLGSTLGHSIGLFMPERAMSYEIDNPTSLWMFYKDERTDFQKAIDKRTPRPIINPFQTTKYEKFPVFVPEDKTKKKKKKKKVFILDENGEYKYISEAQDD